MMSETCSEGLAHTKLKEGQDRLNLKDVDRILLVNEDSVKEGGSSCMFDSSSGDFKPCTFLLMSDEFVLENFMTFRLQAELEISFSYMSESDFCERLHDAISAYTEDVRSPAMMFHICKSKILICKNESGTTVVGPVQSQSSVSDITPHIGTVEEIMAIGAKGKKKGKFDLKETVIDVELLQRSGFHCEGKVQCSVPSVHYEVCDSKLRNIACRLPLDVAITVQSDCRIACLCQHFGDGIQRQLILMKNCISQNFKEHGVTSVKPYHFRIPGLASVLHVVYPNGVPDAELVTERASLHRLLALPMDRPLLRRSNVYIFPSERKDVYLHNVHEGLSHSKDGTVSVVYGKYAYHHYMQDHMDDNHWGCAYRSLQTLCSWLRLQGYIDRAVPTHKEIQQTLVHVGDKPANFVGTRDWIGSIEVSTVLNQLYDVTSKIMFVSNGAELANKGRELANHFQVQGTPVMIGGGAYAHTILGVDFSEMTGELKFLVLDPHYTGEENLKTIQNKGWCGWKDIDFWDPTVFYNLCLPQRPIEI